MYAVAKAFNIKKMIEIGTHRAFSTIVFGRAILSNDGHNVGISIANRR